MGPVVAGKGTFDVQARVDGELAAEAQLLAAFAPLPMRR